MFCAIIIIPSDSCLVVDVFGVTAKLGVGAVVIAVVIAVGAVICFWYGVSFELLFVISN